LNDFYVVQSHEGNYIMIGTTLAITYNAVAKTLLRVKDDGYSADYYLDDVAVSSCKFSASVKHTIPAKGVAGESHIVRLDVEHYDVDALYTHTSSAWTVVKTFDAVQNSADLLLAHTALDTVIDATFMAKVIGRDS
jgi:uncharacterized protein (DUF427 family)